MDAAAILKATTGCDAMIASDTGRRILDAVDANFDAQLATTGTSLPGLTRQSIFPGKCCVEA
jgi:hypothetical protein